jgi:hypothetical protein
VIRPVIEPGDRRYTRGKRGCWGIGGADGTRVDGIARIAARRAATSTIRTSRVNGADHDHGIVLVHVRDNDHGSDHVHDKAHVHA